LAGTTLLGRLRTTNPSAISAGKERTIATAITSESLAAKMNGVVR
jgi:hypothetical protein